MRDLRIYTVVTNKAQSVYWWRCGLEDPRLKSWQRSEIVSSVKHPDRLWGPPSLLYKGIRDCLQGLKWQGCGVDQSFTFSAEVKNGWRGTSNPPILFQRMERDTSTFTIQQLPVLLLDFPNKYNSSHFEALQLTNSKVTGAQHKSLSHI